MYTVFTRLSAALELAPHLRTNFFKERRTNYFQMRRLIEARRRRNMKQPQILNQSQKFIFLYYNAF